MENPYQKIIGLINGSAGNEQNAHFRVCRVVSVSPLTLEIAGITQKDNIRCNASLLPGERRELKQIQTGGVEYRHTEETTSAAFKVGDNLLALTIDDQDFIIICRVVTV